MKIRKEKKFKRNLGRWMEKKCEVRGAVTTQVTQTNYKARLEYIVRLSALCWTKNRDIRKGMINEVERKEVKWQRKDGMAEKARSRFGMIGRGGGMIRFKH